MGTTYQVLESGLEPDNESAQAIRRQHDAIAHEKARSIAWNGQQGLFADGHAPLRCSPREFNEFGCGEAPLHLLSDSHSLQRRSYSPKSRRSLLATPRAPRRRLGALIGIHCDQRNPGNGSAGGPSP